MDPMERDGLVAKSMQINWIIWGALLASLAIYIVIANLVTTQNPELGQNMPLETFNTLRYALMAVAAGILVITPFVKKLLLGAGTYTANADAPPVQEPPIKHTLPIGPRHPAIVRYTTAMLVSLAMSESIAIFGLVLAFLGRDMMTMYVMIGVSAAAMVYHRPNAEQVRDMMSPPGA